MLENPSQNPKASEASKQEVKVSSALSDTNTISAQPIQDGSLKTKSEDSMKVNRGDKIHSANAETRKAGKRLNHLCLGHMECDKEMIIDLEQNLK